ncbi:hypothetical protein NUW58_g6617 [Xylaria curta]|uniref:Uncharacterized protein n=1 Tax=Xylaria curta TaxID=42375 RepID=A0ACC1NS14_9PEZI|nr:hypothetical protein NUW58_g6617 [Xylaria curta]
MSPMVWTAAELAHRHIMYLTEAQLREIAKLGHEYSDTEYPLDAVNKQSTLLPLLHDKPQIRQSLQIGPALAVLRGLDPDAFSMRQNFIIFAGLSSHVGLRRATQSGGKVVGKVRPNRGLTHDSLCDYSMMRCDNVMPVHTDPAADVVAMYVLEPAAT